MNIVITGASGGIGAALARARAARGDTVVLAARREPALRAVAADCGGRATAVVADVTRRPEVERLRDAALALGPVDVWVNNVGRGIARPVLELTDADVDEMVAVNIRSALYGMQAIAPHLVARNAGHLVNVSSFLGRIPLVSIRSMYSAAKAALISLTASLRMELAQRAPGVHVSVVMPGIVTTDFARNALNAPPAPGGWAGGGPAAVATQTAEEVAAAISGLIDQGAAGSGLDHPAAELYTQPAQPGMAVEYVRDPVAFEQRLRGR
jgi:short-subunit dehydrogenase